MKSNEQNKIENKIEEPIITNEKPSEYHTELKIIIAEEKKDENTN